MGVKLRVDCATFSGSRCYFARLRPAQEPRQHERDAALDQSEPDERGLVVVGRDHFADRDDANRGARAVAGRGETDGETAAVGEPFHRHADAGRINRATADAGDDGAEIEQRQRIGIAVDDPTDGDHDAAEGNHELGSSLRTEHVDDPALDRREPCFERDEYGEGDLDRGDGPAVRLVDRIDE